MREEVLIRPAEKEDIGLVAQLEQQIFFGAMESAESRGCKRTPGEYFFSGNM